MTLTRGMVRNAATTPLDARLMDMAQVVCNTDGSPRVGVLGNAVLNMVSTTATTGTRTLSVAAGEYVASKGKADGVTIMTNDGAVAVPLTAPPGSNSRIVVLWVRHQDSTTGDGASTPIFGTTDGGAAATPTKPTIPTGATELATLRDYAGTTSSGGGSNVLTNTYQMTAERGGTVAFRNATERDAWTTAVDGQRAWVDDTDAYYVWVNSTVGWVHDGGKPELGAVTFGALYKTRTGSAATTVRRQCGRIYLDGTSDVNQTVTFVAGTTYTLGNVAAGFRPLAQVEGLVRFGSNLAVLAVGTGGDILFAAAVGGTYNLDTLIIGLGGMISWPDPKLG